MDIRASVDSQKLIFDSLVNAKENDRLSHAYLFHGDKGVGKKEMAYALGCLMYCKHGGCLECETCRSIMNNNHMNVEYIGIEDKKTMISKEQITKLQEEFSKTSLQDGVRVYIVDGIDTASTAAQNSLLKFIEEPVNNTPTIGIFLATEVSNVVSTIISRCNLIHFKALPISYIKDRVINSGVGELEAILAASLTNNVGDAMAICESKSFTVNKDLFLQFLDIENNRDMVLFYLNNLAHYQDLSSLNMLLSWLLLFLGDVNLSINGSDGLILRPLYDKIKVYKRRYNNSIGSKLEFILALQNKLRFNVTGKNILHELISNFI